MTSIKPKRLSEGFTDFSKLRAVQTNNVASKEQIAERFSKNPDMSKVTVRRSKPKPSPFDQRFRKRVAVYCRVSTDNISQTPSLLTQRKYYVNLVRQRRDLLGSRYICHRDTETWRSY